MVGSSVPTQNPSAALPCTWVKHMAVTKTSCSPTLYSLCWLLHKLRGKENCKMGALLSYTAPLVITAQGKYHNLAFFLPRCPSDMLGWHPPEPKISGDGGQTDRHTHTDLHPIKCISLGNQPTK